MPIDEATAILLIDGIDAGEPTVAEVVATASIFAARPVAGASSTS